MIKVVECPNELNFLVTPTLAPETPTPVKPQAPPTPREPVAPPKPADPLVVPRPEERPAPCGPSTCPVE